MQIEIPDSLLKKLNTNLGELRIFPDRNQWIVELKIGPETVRGYGVDIQAAFWQLENRFVFYQDRKAGRV